MIERQINFDELPEDLRRVLAYWQSLGGDDLRCRWRDFHLDQLPPRLLPMTLVIDVAPDATQNRFRFWGTGISLIHGADLTGETIGALKPPAFAEAVQRHHARLAENPVPSATVYGFARHGGFEHTQYVLRLPLSEDGATLSQIVAVIEMTDAALEKISKRRPPGSL